MSIERGYAGDAIFGTAADRRAAALREEEDRAAERQEKIASQTSPTNGPEDRIRIWEKLHALDLPRAASHKLIGVIARETDLTVEEVQREQQRRAGHYATPAGQSA